AAAARISVSISASSILADPASLASTSHAVLLGPPGVARDAALQLNNTFTFSELSPTNYLLTIYSRDYFFPPLRVDVTAPTEGNADEIQVWQTFRGNEWNHKGILYGSGRGELSFAVQPSLQKDFYEPRGAFSLVGFLMSPMILMGLVSLAFIIGVPYMMENLDPESKAELEEMQRSNPLNSQGAAAFQNFDLASFLAG
ncbi:hypothetical protein K470DRAFT_200188, partial [Piedraia hortae CBS 480.64]